MAGRSVGMFELLTSRRRWRRAERRRRVRFSGSAAVVEEAELEDVAELARGREKGDREKRLRRGSGGGEGEAGAVV